jgi:G3E family GTPase
MSDFIVLTGFLGSGKTTLLADFLALPEAADTAVIVNEIGEIGLDGAILAEGGEFPIAMLSNGCVCCSLGGDLERTVGILVDDRRRAGLPPYARIVLETSGLSKPGPILRSLAGLAPLRMRVGVVATFDCRQGAASDGFEEAAAQWAGAQTLVLTKRDLASPEERARARAAARGVNPIAELIDTDDRRAAVRAAFALRETAPSAGSPPSIASVGRRHPRIRVLLVRPEDRIRWDDLAEWLDNLAGLCGERLLRMKGVVRLADHSQPMLVQSVGTLFSAPRALRADVDSGSFLVLILRDVDPADLARIAPSLRLEVTELGREDAVARGAAPTMRRARSAQ